MTTAADVLKAARELIAKPGGWMQQFYARDSLGNNANWDTPDAECFCLLGAMARAAGTTDDPGLFRARDVVRGLIPFEHGIASWNDVCGRTQGEVVALLDAAIAKATTP